MRINVLGVAISVTNMSEAVTAIQGWIKRNEHHYVCVTGVHGVMECQRDPYLTSVHNESGLTVPDGMPLAWAGRIEGFKDMGRVYGPDLMLEVCRVSVKERFSHFLYGGNAGVAKELRENLEKRFPGIRVVGTYTPPFRPLNSEEETDLADRVARAKPDVFWVGLSTPKQEYFMAKYLSKLDTKVMVGVGAAFDIHTGHVRDAPEWIKKLGMQWAHRLIQEPRRLWKRYLYNNPRFVCLYLKQYLLKQRSNQNS